MKKYRPSNGCEGIDFMAQWCDKCRHYVPPNTVDDMCEIQAFTTIYEVTDDEYPSEWTYDDNDQPCCTAFEQKISDPPTANILPEGSGCR